MRKIVLFLVCLFVFTAVFSQSTSVLIWKDVEGMKKEKSRLHIFKPADTINNGVSVIICPGGSYAHLYGIKWEGFEVAQWLNSVGVTAFVLEYRVGKNGYHHPAMIEDVQRSIQLVRKNAQNYGIDPELVGVMGFSAGGHLSLMAGAFYEEDYLSNHGITVDVDMKPKFVAAIYPVVSMQDSLAHVRSRKNLLGKHFTQEDKDKFSMEMQITENMPPVFIVATEDDPVVDYRNSEALFEALRQLEPDFETDPETEFEFVTKTAYILYDIGGHGFGLNKVNKKFIGNVQKTVFHKSGFDFETKSGKMPEVLDWGNYFLQWVKIVLNE